jgi:hypothetical protein
MFLSSSCVKGDQLWCNRNLVDQIGQAVSRGSLLPSTLPFGFILYPEGRSDEFDPQQTV